MPPFQMRSPLSYTCHIRNDIRKLLCIERKLRTVLYSAHQPAAFSRVAGVPW